MPLQQRTLFGDIKPPTLSVDEAARKIAVSSATIRNWIKTGLLVAAGTARVDLKSFESFQRNIDGKLTARANKSQKEPDNYKSVAEQLLQQIGQKQLSPGTLGMQYEQSLSDSYRNKEGIYYTPDDIVSDMLLSIDEDVARQTFCDPCCGSGNFIVAAIEKGFLPENITGFDIDPVAVAITKERFCAATGMEPNNIRQGDFLSLAITENFTFDNIFTNPPWGKKLQKKQREFIGQSLKAGKSIDTCSLFFFACLKQLSKQGKLGLLLPEAFFNISVFADSRTKALTLNLKRLIDYGKPFHGLITKAQAIILENATNCQGENNVICQTTLQKSVRTQNSFSQNPKAIFNFHCSSSSAKVIDHIYSHEHTTLTNNANWGLGIVTGNNKRFVQNHPQQGFIPVYKGADITKDGLKPVTHYIPEDLSLYQQVAPQELFLSDEKLIYKFISSKLCFFYDNQQRYFLNSANMLIPHKNFPIATKQLCSLLNSDILNWLFQQIFSTHKILRSDIESLPIHYRYFSEHKDFCEKQYCLYLGLERCEDGTYRIKR